MNRVIWLVGLNIALVGSALAQPAAGQSGEKPWFQAMWDQGVDVSIKAVKQGYEVLQKQGRPMAENILKATPGAFKTLQDNLNQVIKKVGPELKPSSLQQKKELLLELWRLRSAIDVAALADPQLLKMTTGIDLNQLTGMQKKYQVVVARAKKLDPKTFASL